VQGYTHHNSIGGQFRGLPSGLAMPIGPHVAPTLGFGGKRGVLGHKAMGFFGQPRQIAQRIDNARDASNRHQAHRIEMARETSNRHQARREAMLRKKGR
jgi:hypothetical protein